VQPKLAYTILRRAIMEPVKVTSTRLTQFRYPSVEGNFDLTLTKAENEPDKIEVGIHSKLGWLSFRNDEEIAVLVDLLIKYLEGGIDYKNIVK